MCICMYRIRESVPIERFGTLLKMIKSEIYSVVKLSAEAAHLKLENLLYVEHMGGTFV